MIYPIENDILVMTRCIYVHIKYLHYPTLQKHNILLASLLNIQMRSCSGRETLVIEAICRRLQSTRMYVATYVVLLINLPN